MEVRIDCAARFPRADAKIPAMYVSGRHAREDGVTVFAGRSHQRGSGDGGQATAFAQKIQHIEAPCAQRNLLQRYGIGIEFIDDLGNACGIEFPVAADAKMNIVGSESNFQATAMGLNNAFNNAFNNQAARTGPMAGAPCDTPAVGTYVTSALPSGIFYTRD